MKICIEKDDMEGQCMIKGIQRRMCCEGRTEGWEVLDEQVDGEDVLGGCPVHKEERKRMRWGQVAGKWYEGDHTTPHHTSTSRLAFRLSEVKCWSELDTKVLSPSLFRVKMPGSSHHFS